MKHRGLRHFMTLVLLATLAMSLLPQTASIAFAALETASPDFQDPPPKDDPTRAANDEALRQSLDIAPAPPLHSRKNDEAEYFYPYRKALTLHAGPVYKTNDTSHPYSVLGVLYLFPFRKLQSLESGAELLSDGSGTLHLSKRFLFSRGTFRPYWKVGGGIRIIPSEQLVTFIELKNYEVRGAVGFESLVRGAQSVRLEAEANWSTIGAQLIATIGYVWAW